MLKTITSSESKVRNDFGCGWLGNIVIDYGLDWKNVHCRGHVLLLGDVIVNDTHAYFHIATETAWEPLTYMWDLIIGENYPSVSYMYKAEEPGQILYVNTDIDGYYYPERFVLDLDLPEDVFGTAINKYELYESEERLLEDLHEIVGKRFKTYEEVSEYFKEIAKEHIAIIEKYRSKH